MLSTICEVNKLIYPTYKKSLRKSVTVRGRRIYNFKKYVGKKVSLITCYGIIKPFKKATILRGQIECSRKFHGTHVSMITHFRNS